jgi:hypothetical protein
MTRQRQAAQARQYRVCGGRSPGKYPTPSKMTIGKDNQMKVKPRWSGRFWPGRERGAVDIRRLVELPVRTGTIENAGLVPILYLFVTLPHYHRNSILIQKPFN